MSFAQNVIGVAVPPEALRLLRNAAATQLMLETEPLQGSMDDVDYQEVTYEAQGAAGLVCLLGDERPVVQMGMPVSVQDALSSALDLAVSKVTEEAVMDAILRARAEPDNALSTEDLAHASAATYESLLRFKLDTIGII